MTNRINAKDLGCDSLAACHPRYRVRVSRVYTYTYIHAYMFGEGSVAEGNFTEREPLTRVSSTVSSLSRGRREREGANVRREDSGRGWRGAINASRGM